VQIGNRRDLVLPANDTLFTSGTLGRYSAMLNRPATERSPPQPPPDHRPNRSQTRTERELLDPVSTNFEVFLLLSVLKVAVVLVITLTAVAYTVLLERKVIGRMQNRWGPSRVGPFGLLQPLADGIKLFLKEDLMPLAVERPLFMLAPMIALGCALISIAVVPFGAPHDVHGVDLFEIANVNIGLLVILGITSIGVYGIALSGWSSNNKYSLLGSLRSTAQVISYELALGLSLVGVVLRAQSLNLRDIVDSQSAHGMLSWNIFGGFQFVAFFIYLMAPTPRPTARRSTCPRPRPSWSPATTPSTAP
jgi:NADH-quinone oxidoreductase subunit H